MFALHICVNLATLKLLGPSSEGLQAVQAYNTQIHHRSQIARTLYELVTLTTVDDDVSDALQWEGSSMILITALPEEWNAIKAQTWYDEEFGPQDMPTAYASTDEVDLMIRKQVANQSSHHQAQILLAGSNSMLPTSQLEWSLPTIFSSPLELGNLVFCSSIYICNVGRAVLFRNLDTQFLSLIFDLLRIMRFDTPNWPLLNRATELLGFSSCSARTGNGIRIVLAKGLRTEDDGTCYLQLPPINTKANEPTLASMRLAYARERSSKAALAGHRASDQARFALTAGNLSSPQKRRQHGNQFIMAEDILDDLDLTIPDLLKVLDFPYLRFVYEAQQVMSTF